MKSALFAAAVATALISVPLAVTAGGEYTGGVVNAGQDAWSQEAFYEPCMNGDVSASGTFSSQLAEDKAIVRMNLSHAADS